MIKEQNRIFKRVQIFSDLILITTSFFIGYFLRDKILNLYPLDAYLWGENLRSIGYYALYIGLLPILLIILGGLLSYFGMYKSAGVTPISEALSIIIKATFLGFVIFGSYIFIVRMQQDVSRLFIGFTFFAAAILLSAEKIAMFYIYKHLSRKDSSFRSALIVFRRIIIIGTNQRAKSLMRMINNNPDWGIRIIGILDLTDERKGEKIEGYEILGSMDDMSKIINNNIVDEVVFIVPRSWLNKIEPTMLYCESAGLKVNLAVNLFELKFSKAKQTDLQGFPLLTFETTTIKLGHLFIKRLIDFVISGIGLFALSPFYIVVAIIIKCTSPGPVLYKHKRCTMYGREFVFYKFRTMTADAESKLNDILMYNEMEGPVFKMKNDPRVTKVGKYLRKYSIDELPQIWNVFIGDMSLVGPRPPLPYEVENYDMWQRRRLSMRPGITCLWQAGGRNKIVNFEEWMKLDLEYIDNWSLLLDVKILFKTIPVVLFGVGAR